MNETTPSTRLGPKFTAAFWGGIFVLLALLWALTGVFLLPVNRARQAQFNVDALERYIFSYGVVHGDLIPGLADLPDFHIISAYDSLSLKSSDLSRGIFGGYVYDLDFGPDQQYSISASPIGFFTPKIEFGITEAGELRMNQEGVDATADSQDEISKWRIIPRNEHMRSAKLPDYL